MTALVLRRAVEEAGGTLRASRGDLVVRMPMGTLAPALMRSLRARKAEVMALLEAEAATVADTRRRAENALSPEALADPAEITVRGVELP